MGKPQNTFKKLKCCNGELKSDERRTHFRRLQLSTGEYSLQTHGLLALDCSKLKNGDQNYSLMSEEYLRARNKKQPKGTKNW
jgi:hypothetical protein